MFNGVSWDVGWDSHWEYWRIKDGWLGNSRGPIESLEV